ncbi:MAG: SpoIIE family protein phosphatase [Acidimicrobiales bacterium]
MTVERSPGEWNLAVRQQAAVAHLGQIGLQTADLEELLRETMVTAADTLGITDVGLFEMRPDGGELRGWAALEDGRFLSRRRMAKLRVAAGTGSLPGYAADGAVPVVAEDLVNDPRFRAMAPQRGLPLRSAIAAPIGWGQRAVGVLAVYDRVLRRWTDDEVHFVQSVANTVGLAIQRAHIEDELRDSTARLDLSLSAGGLGAWSWDLDGDRLVLSPAALSMYGLGADGFEGTSAALLALIHPEDRDGHRIPREGAPTPDEVHQLFRIIRPDTGEVRWLESWGRRLVVPAGGVHLVGVVSDVTDRRRAEQLQEALLEREHAARVEAERARERLAFLSEASAVLGASLDPEVTLHQFAELCVPAIADVAFVDLVDDDGLLQEHAGLATDGDLLAAARELRAVRKALGGAAPTDTGHRVALAGTPVITEEITEELLDAAAADAHHRELLHRVAARSTIMAPMSSRGRPIGVLTLVRTGDAEPFDQRDDLPFVEELAGRAALAIDNGQLYRSRARVARSLQEALLPPALPVIDGVALAARYDVAEADVEIGGDFYDVISMGPRSWGVVVGDVCGRGPDAAALTGLVRHSLRTAVVDEQVPSRVLGRTNQAVLAQIDDARFCTAAFLRMDLAERPGGQVRVVASSAGHPRPVLVRAEGEVSVLPCPGTLLGVVEDPDLVDAEVVLGPGDAIVLYTDGVTEARREHELFGEGRLVEALVGLAGLPADRIAGGLDEAVAAFRRSARDDTAIVVVQAAPPP